MILPKDKKVSDNKNILIFNNILCMFYYLNKSFTDKFKLIVIKTIQIIVQLFTAYTFIIYGITFFTHYRKDVLLSFWKPKYNITKPLLNNDNHKTTYQFKCPALTTNSENNLTIDNSNNVYFTFESEKDKKNYDDIIDITNMIVFSIYDVAPTISGIPLILYGTQIIILIAYFYTSYPIIKDDKIQVEFLAFLFNPNEQKKNINNHVHSIFNNIIKALDYTIQYGKICFNDLKNEQNILSNIYDKKNKRSRVYSTSDKTNLIDNIKQFYISIYGEFFIRLKKSNLITPENLTQEVHSKFCHFYRLFMMIIFFFITFSAFIAQAIVLFLEINARVEKRLNYYNNCYQQQQTVLLPTLSITDLIYIQTSHKDIDIADNEFYFSYINTTDEEKSFTSYLTLLLIEFKVYINNTTSINGIITLYISTVFGAWWISFYTLLNIFCHVDKIIWLKQIGRELEKCINLMNYLAIVNNDNKKLYESIITTYINFELFRRHYSKFKELTKFLFFQSTLACLLLILILFTIEKNIENEYSSLLLIMIAYMIVLMNIYYFFDAMLLNMIKNINIKILRLLASTKLDNFLFNQITDLWHREIRSQHEIKRLYAVNVLGLYITYDNIAILNSYLLAVWLMVVKSHRQKNYTNE